MGCDIHVHTEVKIEGKWRHWGTPTASRWYKLFEKLAGVRGDIKNAVVVPKGLPEDATYETLFDFNRDNNYHSISWLNIEEIKEVYKWWYVVVRQPKNPYVMNTIEDLFGYCMGNGWDELSNDIEDIRWVFWFDN